MQTDQALRIGRHEMWIGTEQLHPHRRARQRTPGLQQLRAGAEKSAARQDALRHPHEFANPPVVAADARQHLAHQRIGQPFHGREKNLK